MQYGAKDISLPSTYFRTHCRRQMWSLAHQHCESEPDGYLGEHISRGKIWCSVCHITHYTELKSSAGFPL